MPVINGAAKIPRDVLLRPRDPLILRDGRPFSTDPGARAFTLDWPLPSTLAGALRTHIGAATGTDWHNGGARTQQLGIEMRGAFLVDRCADDDPWIPYFPAPADAVVYRPTDGDETCGHVDPNRPLEIMRLWPDEHLADGEGCDMPSVDDFTLLPMRIEKDEKQLTTYRFWSLEDTTAWLLGGKALPKRHRPAIEQETRTHVAVDATTLTSVEGRLFATTGLAFSPASRERWPDHRESAILCRVALPGTNGRTWAPEPAFLPLGGERRQVRLATWEQADPDPWTAPLELVKELTGKKTLRLQLVTPAIFRTGWYPGWLTQRHRDRNPAPITGLGLKLRAAAIERRIPVSGWDYTNRCEKPIRYAVPAGGAYFFDVAKPLTEQQVKDLWLAPSPTGSGIAKTDLAWSSQASGKMSNGEPEKGDRSWLWLDGCSTYGRSARSTAAPVNRPASSTCRWRARKSPIGRTFPAPV